jgi:hypothetical protein
MARKSTNSNNTETTTDNTQKQLDGTKAIAGTKYYEDNARLVKRDKNGPIMLSTFTARITRRLVYHDGPKSTTYFEIQGQRHNPEQPDQPIDLPQILVSAADFSGMSWALEKWGSDAIIFPEANAVADIRTAIQLASRPTTKNIYTHTGWTEIDGLPTYLHFNGGINHTGNNKAITVQLPNELSRYSLPEPSVQAFTESLRASLRLVNLGPPEITWPILLATFRAAIGDADFAVHIAGRTGSFKSELASLMQSHYGAQMDARHLPASWSATANALEALTYRAKNAIITIDDYVPVGSSYQVKALDAKVDQVIRAQGNQQGRARLGDATQLQQTYYPRGIILSTGEDIPTGHSVRGRMMILELEPNSINPTKLTAAQKSRPLYAQQMSNWIQWIAQTQPFQELRDLAQHKRDEYIDIGHGRTPTMLGQLIATAHLLERFARQSTIDPKLVATIATSAEQALVDAARNQTQYLQQADPVLGFLETIRSLIGTDKGHFRTLNGGVPIDAPQWGWKTEEVEGEMQRYKPQGPCLGWINTSQQLFYVNADIIPMIIGRSGGKIALTETTLLKRLAGSGIVPKRDSARQRNTIRITAEGIQRQVVPIMISSLIEQPQ